MTTNRHSTEFQEQALSKARQRGTRSVQDVANDLNIPVGTLRKWISKSNRKHEVSGPAAQLPDDLPAQSWSPYQRLLALNQTHAMPETQQHAWCREKGLFERIDLPKLLSQTARDSEYRIDPFNREERNKLIDACRPDERPLVAFWFETGLRPSELHALRWSRIDLPGKRILIDIVQVEKKTKRAPKRRPGHDGLT